MEIVLRNSKESRSIELHEGKITSIQSNSIKTIFSNLCNDYSFSYISNHNLLFLGDTVDKEIELFSRGIVDYDLVDNVISILELNDDFLKRKIEQLSYTERIFVNILRCISSLDRMIILDDIFISLDYNKQKLFLNLLNFLKENNYIILVSSKDVNYLYKYSDYSIVWNSKTFSYDVTNNIYTDVKYLLDNKFEVPTLSYITYKAKIDKNVKLFYSKDVRDIIKDIYKHVEFK